MNCIIHLSKYSKTKNIRQRVVDSLECIKHEFSSTKLQFTRTSQYFTMGSKTFIVLIALIVIVGMVLAQPCGGCGNCGSCNGGCGGCGSCGGCRGGYGGRVYRRGGSGILPLLALSSIF